MAAVDFFGASPFVQKHSDWKTFSWHIFGQQTFGWQTFGLIDILQKDIWMTDIWLTAIFVYWHLGDRHLTYSDSVEWHLAELTYIMLIDIWPTDIWLADIWLADIRLADIWLTNIGWTWHLANRYLANRHLVDCLLVIRPNGFRPKEVEPTFFCRYRIWERWATEICLIFFCIIVIKLFMAVIY